MSSDSAFTNSDEFMSGVQSVFEVLSKHSKALIVFGVLLAAGGGTLALVANRKQERTDAGRNALYQATKSLDTELRGIALAQAPAPAPAEKGKAAPKPAQPNVDSIMFTKINVDTQLSDAVSKFKIVAAEYSDTRPGLESMLSLGKLYLNHGEPAEAETWFKLAAAHAPTSLDKAIAWSSVADSLEDQGKPQDALKAIDQAMGAGEATVTADLMLDKARVYEALKETTQAKAVYQQIQTQFPNSDYAKFAGLYSSRL